MKQQSQKGGAATGFIIGLVIGLAVALAVAIYVTKVPTPFTNKNQPRSAEQDAAEAQKNKDWNPNGALQNKPASSAAENPDAHKDARKDDVKEPAKEPAKEAPKEKEAAKESTKDLTKESAKSEPKPAVTADPLGDLVKSKTAPGRRPGATIRLPILCKRAPSAARPRPMRSAPS